MKNIELRDRELDLRIMLVTEFIVNLDCHTRFLEKNYNDRYMLKTCITIYRLK